MVWIFDLNSRNGNINSLFYFHFYCYYFKDIEYIIVYSFSTLKKEFSKKYFFKAEFEAVRVFKAEFEGVGVHL